MEIVLTVFTIFSYSCTLFWFIICIFWPSEFGEPFYDAVIVFAAVRVKTGGAVLDAVGSVCESSAAFPPHCIERTVAEKAVEIVHVGTLVAGEEFAVLMAEIRVIFAHAAVHLFSESVKWVFKVLVVLCNKWRSHLPIIPQTLSLSRLYRAP